MAPTNTDTVQPKVRLRKALHQRLTAVARANKASLNGEIVRRLEASFLHEALEKRLSAASREARWGSSNWKAISVLPEQMLEVMKLLEHLTEAVQGSVPKNTKISQGPAPFDFDTAPAVRSRRRPKPAISEKEGEK